ncbi:putative protein SOSEKI [Dioscorea sansibarensis]
MEGRKERPRPWPEPPPPKQQEKRIPVVYYLSKNHHLEHPHYIEVPISSSEGLYLKDVIHRFVLLRGKSMPSMYSWSCKRSYKNGFVWHDLSDDDLILPTNAKDYVLKGSEILDSTPSEHNGDKLKFDILKQYQQDSHAFTRTQEPLSSSSSSSPSTVNASTQTDDNGERRKPNGRRRSDEMLRLPLALSPSSSCAMTDTTLESLIKADARKMSNFKILEEEQMFVPVKAKSKAANLLVQLISCGAISTKGHQSFPKPKFSPMNFDSPMSAVSTAMIGELNSPLDNSPRFRGLRMNEKDYFSGSLLETTNNKEGVGEGIPVILRSSSCKESRCCKSPRPKEEEYKYFDSPGSKCFPRTRRVTTLKSCRNESLMSPSSGCGQSRVLGSSYYGSNRITDSSSVRGSVIRLGSFREDESDQD